MWTGAQVLTPAGLGLWNPSDRCVRSHLLGRHRNRGRCGELVGNIGGEGSARVAVG